MNKKEKSIQELLQSIGSQYGINKNNIFHGRNKEKKSPWRLTVERIDGMIEVGELVLGNYNILYKDNEVYIEDGMVFQKNSPDTLSSFPVYRYTKEFK